MAKAAIKQIAVDNFLGSLGGVSERDAIDNLNMDAKMYKWNAATVSAIRKGIREHFKRKLLVGK